MAAIAKRSGVSSADFYKHFKGKDDCFVAAYDDAVERIRAAVLEACGGAGGETGGGGGSGETGGGGGDETGDGDGGGETGASGGGPSDWPSAVRAGLAALLGFLAAEPARARLVLIEGLFAGPAIHDRYQRALDSFAPYLRDGAGGPTPPHANHVEGDMPRKRDSHAPESVEGALIGGIAALISKRILAGEEESLPDLLPELTRFTLAPYAAGG